MTHDCATYWHGGSAISGDLVLPADQTGLSRSGDTGVHVTTDRGLAETYAATAPGAAWIYEVEPLGPLEPVPSTIPGTPTIAFRCASARIIRRFTISNARRQRLQAGVVRAAAIIDERSAP